MPEPGWYPDGTTPGVTRWWDGGRWTEQVHATAAPNDGQGVQRGAVSGEQPVEAATVPNGPVMAFACKIDGARTQVSIYDDRIESVQTTGVSAGKITAGILTAGLSLAATGVGKGSYTSGKPLGLDVIRLDTVTGVASRKDSGSWIVTVTTPAMMIPMVVSKNEAQQVVRVLNDLVAKARQAQVPAAPQVVVNVAGSGPSDAAAIQAAQIAALSSPDLVANLERIANLRFQRLITDEEYAAMKAKLLGG